MGKVVREGVSKGAVLKLKEVTDEKSQVKSNRKLCSRKTFIHASLVHFLLCFNVLLSPPHPILLAPSPLSPMPSVLRFSLFHLLHRSILVSSLHVFSRFSSDSSLAYILIFILQLSKPSDRGREGRKEMMTTGIFPNFFLACLQRLRSAKQICPKVQDPRGLQSNSSVQTPSSTPHHSTSALVSFLDN